MGCVPHNRTQLDYRMQESLSQAERQQLAADAHKAARATGLEQMMAASRNGGVTRANLTQSNPLAVKVRHDLSPNITLAITVLATRFAKMAHGLGRLFMYNRLLFSVIVERLTAAVLMSNLGGSWTVLKAPYCSDLMTAVQHAVDRR